MMKLTTAVAAAIIGAGIASVAPAQAQSIHPDHNTFASDFNNGRYLPIGGISLLRLDDNGSDAVQEVGFRGRGFRGRGFRSRGFRGFRGRGFRSRGFRSRGFRSRGFNRGFHHGGFGHRKFIKLKKF